VKEQFHKELQMIDIKTINASEKGQIGPSTTVWAARGDGSCPNCASALKEGGKTANIQASSGVIWGIPVHYIPLGSLSGRDLGKKLCRNAPSMLPKS
jgi:hypothetical protein